MRRDTSWRVVVAALFVFLLAIVSTAQAAIDPTKVQKLVAGDGTAGELFGYSIAVSGDTAIIGAWGDDSDKGATYVFRRATDGTWSQQAKLTADDGAYGDVFGVAVALSADGRTAVIGAAGNTAADTSRPGLAYIFVYSGNSWTQQAKLTAADGAGDAAYDTRDGLAELHGDLFGTSVSLSADGSTALIGASGAAEARGTAYIFTRTANGDWKQQAKLTATDTDDRELGDSVSLSADGGTALIGASNAAYIFIRTDGDVWSQKTKLAAAEGDKGRSFGRSVSLSADGSTALVGAYDYKDRNSTDNGEGFGAAYIFTRAKDVWSLQQELSDDIPENARTSNEGFGWAVSLSGDTALVGTLEVYNDKGKVSFPFYIFTRTEEVWNRQHELAAEPEKAGEDPDGYYGSSVAVSKDTALIGTVVDGEFKGAAHVFTRMGGWLPEHRAAAKGTQR
ncbi:hypothetical protein [Candidatus Electronema sp. PJ]|uniref:hypothetical protein n=1 Tax=Candidatus Electronema sp. PJ TaxID=3401572 RepID=UPI003AA8A242